MQMTRKIALAATVLAVVGGTSQMALKRIGAWQQSAEASPAPLPVGITPLAAEALSVAVPDAPARAPRLPETAMLPVAPLLDPAPTALPLKPTLPTLDIADPACGIELSLAAQPAAMMGLTLLAPCRAEQRVVLRHGGLAVTGRTSMTGALFLTLPALEHMARVSVLFGDGETIAAEVEMPELASLRRFGVQWVEADAFQLHAFEGGTDYSAAGHVWASEPHLPPTGVPPQGGFLSRLGDDTVPLPMMAEVYTFPETGRAHIVIEAAVTEATCGRELLGETLHSESGAVEVSELTLAMPDCDAIGDILVLKDVFPDLKIANAQ